MGMKVCRCLAILLLGPWNPSVQQLTPCVLSLSCSCDCEIQAADMLLDSYL